MNRWVDPVRWFESLGECQCGKPAVGTLRGPQNESYGPACRKCGDARVIRAEKDRAKAAAEAGGETWPSATPSSRRCTASRPSATPSSCAGRSRMR
jgi:hypothetical protein